MIEYIVSGSFYKGSGLEEIVRCRDCKYLNKLGCEYEVYECNFILMDVTLDDFCAWGERK